MNTLERDAFLPEAASAAGGVDADRDALAQAISIIDQHLSVLIRRELVSSAEMTDLLLDVRSLLVEHNAN
jgi:hypothetical protein